MSADRSLRSHGTFSAVIDRRYRRSLCGGSGFSPNSIRNSITRSLPRCYTASALSPVARGVGDGRCLGSRQLFSQFAADPQDYLANIFPHGRILRGHGAAASLRFEPSLIPDDFLNHRQLAEQGGFDLRGHDTKNITSNKHWLCHAALHSFKAMVRSQMPSLRRFCTVPARRGAEGIFCPIADRKVPRETR